MRLIPAIGLAGLLMVVGCRSSQQPSAEEQEALRQRRIARLEVENAQRLRGEDNNPATTRPFTRANLNKTYQNFRVLIDFLLRRPGPLDLANQMKSTSADERRSAILDYADWGIGRNANAQKYYAELAFGAEGIAPDPDYTVRAGAIRALNRARAREYTALYIKTLGNKDEYDLVRLEAAKALANMPDEKSVEVLTKVMADPEETKDIRIAAADALRNHKQFSVAQALINVLQDRAFGVSYQARKSLVLLTGRDFGYSTRNWLKYLSTAANPFA